MVGGKAIPYEGYYFRILKAQGPNGDGGAKNYVQSDRITGGFALIAWPAAFESSGIMTFIVGADGDVYQKDLGPDTSRVASAITKFDSDLSWERAAITNEKQLKRAALGKDVHSPNEVRLLTERARSSEHRRCPAL